MKNLLFTIIAFIGFSAASSASVTTRQVSNNQATILTQACEEANAITCCTRRGKSSNGQAVVISACVKTTGDKAVDMGNACSKASEVVSANIKLLDALAPE